MNEAVSDPNDGPDPMRVTAIRLPEYQFAALSKIAEEEDRVRSSVIRHALRLYIEAYEESH